MLPFLSVAGANSLLPQRGRAAKERAFDRETPAVFALPVACYDTLEWLERFRRRVNDDVRQQALAGFLPAFRERYERRLTLPGPDLEARIGEGDAMLRQLQSEGWALGRLSDDARRRVRDLAVPVGARLHAELDQIAKPKFADGQSRFDLKADAAIFRAVSEGLVECGALDAASAYAGGPLELHSLSIQVNTAQESRFKYGEFDASGRPERATSYFHVDSNDWPSLKCLIYVSDVGRDQGPFRYVAGSHLAMSPYEAAVRKTNDKLRNTAEFLCALPTEYAQHANFGDYIDPASPESLALLAREVEVCDGSSDVILFDNNGVHRGGMVRDGYRYMLQCMFVRAGKSSKILEQADDAMMG